MSRCGGCALRRVRGLAAGQLEDELSRRRGWWHRPSRKDPFSEDDMWSRALERRGWRLPAEPAMPRSVAELGGGEPAPAIGK